MQVNICGVFCVSKHDIKGTVVVYWHTSNFPEEYSLLYGQM
jgi:hypothetical protein